MVDQKVARPRASAQSKVMLWIRTLIPPPASHPVTAGNHECSARVRRESGRTAYGRRRALRLLRRRVRPHLHPLAVPALPHEGQLLRRGATGGVRHHARAGARTPEPTGVTDTLVVRPEQLLDVVTGDLLTDRAVVVEGDRIAAVVAAPEAPTDATVLDLPGATLLPGLVD